MTVETALYPTQLNTTLPTSSDFVSEGDDHLRLLKTVVKTTFPNVAGAVNASQTELNYSVGVTSGIQIQINTKGAIAGQTWTGTHVFPSTTTVGPLTPAIQANLATVTSDAQAQINSKGAIAGQIWSGTHVFPSTTTVGPLTPTIQTSLSTVTSDVQAQINTKGAITGQNWSGTHSFPNTTTVGPLTPAIQGYLSTATSDVQAQINSKASKAGDTYTGAHNYTGATITVPTLAAGSSGNSAASVDYANALAFTSALPAQAGNAGKFVKTNGTTANWSSITFAELASKPTTISGYGITDAVATSGDQAIAGNKSFSGNLLAIGGVLGYGVGVGGTVVQATSKYTAVTLNKPSGQITMHNASLAAGATARFVLYNTCIGASDEVSMWLSDPIGNVSSHIVWVDGVVDGACAVCVKNINTISLPLPIKIGFAVRKGATS